MARTSAALKLDNVFIFPKKKKKAKREFVNDVGRSKLIFEAQRAISGMGYNEVQEESRKYGRRGVCSATVRNMYLKPEDGGTRWPSTRTVEALISLKKGKLKVLYPGDPGYLND